GAAIARDEVSRVDHATDFDLEPLERGIHVTRRGAREPLLAQHVPGFERLANFDIDPASGHLAVEGKTKFKVRREPIRLQRVTAVSQVINHVVKIVLNKM